MAKRIARETTLPVPPVDEAKNLAGAQAGLLDPPSTTTRAPEPPARKVRRLPAIPPNKRFAAIHIDDHASNHQAELFYLQKQIQLQTQMVVVLEDGSVVHGIIEWYDRNCVKVRGKSRTMIYKSAIKYLYKLGEVGTAPQS